MNYDGYYKYNDNIANSYDLDRQEEEHWKLENIYVEKLYRDINLSTLLDLPAGTGRFFQYYRKVEKIIGIDISNNMLNIAKKKQTIFLSIFYCIEEMLSIWIILMAILNMWYACDLCT